MTDIKKIELSQTNSALAELSDVLLKLGGLIDEKKESVASAKQKLQDEADESLRRLELLKNSSQNIIGNIDTVISKLDKILENDGTSNNNN